MAETTIVATVARVEGRAFARSTDGKLRALQEGDALREGEVVVTESGARVELVATGGGRIDLPAGGEVRITADLDEATRADAAAASVEEATVARVLEAIETGADLEQVLEDPAAGLAGGGGGDGSNFVRLLRIAEALSPVEVALETVEPASAQEFDGLADGGGARVGTADDPDVGVEEPVPPVPVLPETLSLQVAAPSLSADPGPTITGTSSAPAGSVVTVRTGGARDLDAITGATALDSLRTGLRAAGASVESVTQGAAFGVFGSRGWEWVAAGYALGGLFLLAKGIITWHMPVAFIVALGGTAGVFWLIDPTHYASPLFHLASGGAMLAAFFIVTDPVSGATTPRGKLLFAAGVGLIVWLIRNFGAFPDGIAFAVLLMNICVPLLDMKTQPRVFGHREAAGGDK